MKKDQKSIEYLLDELKKITNQLESDETSIDKSIDLCGKGNDLLKKCKSRLAEIKLKIYDFEDVECEE